MVTGETHITQVIMKAAIEAVKAVVQVMIVAASECSSGARSVPTSAGPKFDRPTLRQPAFDVIATDR